MKRKPVLLCCLALAALICALSLPAARAEEDVITVNPSSAPLTREETLAMAEKAAAAFYADPALREELASEITLTREVVPALNYPTEEYDVYTLSHGGKSMRFFMETVWEPEENGRYPLYITLHGGGGGSPELNNCEWITMSQYYRGSVQSGIYVACRGITDTWDLHFREDSYPLYERLIEAMIVLYNADPDRVYLLGFSAGGDGVYQVAPRLADRFAAANMSSGHPNDVSLLNLANCPICLQAGIRDWYSESAMRSVRTAEFEAALSGFREKYGFGYEHRVWIHVPEGHNFVDNWDANGVILRDPARFAALAASEDVLEVFLDAQEACGRGRDVPTMSYFSAGEDEAFDRAVTEAVTETLGLETVTQNTNAVRWVSQYSRSPAPEKLVWDLSTRARMREKDTFYWLEAGPDVSRGVITAAYNAETNTITVEAEDVDGDFAILFHPALVDVSRPVTIRTGEIVRTVRVNPSEECLKASILENGDPALACVGRIMYSEIVPQGR
ncbi:MAG: hypothetical protein IJK28_06990 [Clostridia bacterium]|nr:hypothetical protein [Clostridia bacterium]